jgi:hypothetical protein
MVMAQRVVAGRSKDSGQANRSRAWKRGSPVKLKGVRTGINRRGGKPLRLSQTSSTSERAGDRAELSAGGPNSGKPNSGNKKRERGEKGTS